MRVLEYAREEPVGRLASTERETRRAHFEAAVDVDDRVESCLFGSCWTRGSVRHSRPKARDADATGRQRRRGRD